ATFPISAFYFNQFPVYFWVANLIVVPAVTLIISLGILLLACNWIPVFSVFISRMIGFFANSMIKFIEWIEDLPSSVIGVYFSSLEIALFGACLILFLVYLEIKRRRNLMMAF